MIADLSNPSERMGTIHFADGRIEDITCVEWLDDSRFLFYTEHDKYLYDEFIDEVFNRSDPNSSYKFTNHAFYKFKDNGHYEKVIMIDIDHVEVLRREN